VSLVESGSTDTVWTFLMLFLIPQMPTGNVRIVVHGFGQGTQMAATAYSIQHLA